MGMLGALRRDWAVWSLFFVACGILPLVNTIEGSFARTLVLCDAPVPREAQGALFSGSPRCGDRLLVINGGQALSSWAASCESATKVLTMLAAAVSTDVYGRRPVLLLGLLCTAVSVFAFVLACRLPGRARPLFVLGQALQGAFPVELLLQQAAADLAARPGADVLGTFELQGIVKFLPMVLFGFLASTVQVLELRDYTSLWCCVLLVNCGLLLVTWWHFPETKAGGPSEAARRGVLAGMRHEVQEYRKLFGDESGVGRVELLLVYVFVNAISSGRFSILTFSFMMSYFGMTSAQVIVQALPVILIHTSCTPLVGAVCRRLGMRRGFVGTCAFKAGAALLFVLQPLVWWSWFAQYYLSSMASGMDALNSNISKAIFKERVSKVMAMLTLCNYCAAVVASPLYAAAFDARATDYLWRVLPGLISFFLYAVGMVIVFHPSARVWPLLCSGLDEMQRELDEGEASGRKAD